MTTQATDVYSVSQLNHATKTLLEKNLGTVWIEGEVSNFVRASSGHMYFSLKDEGAQVRAAMFRGQQRGLSFKPENGQQVLVKAQVSMYPPRGEYQLIVQHMEVAGVGQLLAQLEALKTKLAAEGLFAQERKRSLPAYPETIGLVTSPTGAAIRDMLHVLDRRYPLARIRVYPSLVQGEHAASTLTRRVHQATHDGHNCVVIVARGGGSLEDLWAFNDEALARTIAASPVPVVTGVGHETDFTLVDFVADLRAPTPSAAAESVSPDSWELAQWIDECAKRLSYRLVERMNKDATQLAHLDHRLHQQHPNEQLNTFRLNLNESYQQLTQTMTLNLANLDAELGQLERRLMSQTPQTVIDDIEETMASSTRRLSLQMRHTMERAQIQMTHTSQRLNSVSPLNTLERGYVIVRDSAKRSAIESSQTVQPGSTLTLQFRDGEREVSALSPKASPNI